MKVIKPLRLGVLYRVVEHHRRLHLAVGILAYFPFSAPPALLSEAGMWTFVAGELGGAPLDVGMAKALREVVVTGKAFAPERTAAPSCRVRVAVGPIDKALHVFGDRHWKTTVPSDPAPFLEMAIRYENAFGGPGYALNPIGKGFAPPEERGALHMLPNIEDPKVPVRAPKDRPPPAGLGAFDPMWPQRRATSGTYDERWFQEVYPGYPDDMDWTTFNTVPEDQRTREALRGDEAVRIENMHPEKAVLETALPGVAGRCFVTQKSGAEEVFREVPMAVETVHLFPHAERGVVVFRGVIPVTEEDAADILHLVVAAERLGKAKPLEHYRTVLAQRLDKAKAHLFALRDRDLLPEAEEGDAPPPETDAVDEMKKLLEREGLVEKHARRRAELELERAREQLREQGIDPDLHVPKELPAAEPAPGLEQLPDFVERMEKMAEEKKAEAEAKRKEAEAEARAVCEAHGLDYDALREAEEKKSGGPPKFTAKGQMEHLREVLEMAQNAGVDLPHVEAQLTDPGLRAKQEEVEAKLRDVYVRFAHEMPPAPAADAEAGERARREIAEEHRAGRGFRGRDLTGVSLAGMDLREADFRDALMEGVDLSGADLRGADFSGAVLARADLTRARLRGAKLAGANLGKARLSETRAERADLSGATLCEADLSEAQLDGANLTGADLAGAAFLSTSFVEVIAPSSNFIESDLSELDLTGADLTKCNFIEVVVTGVSFEGANLTSAVFVRAKGTGTVFRGATLTNLRVVQESVFEDADFSGASLQGASLRATRLSGSDFSGADIEGADFSDSDLRDAKLARARGAGARFVKADLRGADVSAANLMDALLQRADLRGADARGSNLFRADLLRARVDGGTKIEGAETTDVRFNGVRREHAQR